MVGLGACAAVFAVDQITKNMVVNSMDLYERRHVFGPLTLFRTTNSGSAFGIGSGGGALIGILAVVIIVGVLFAGRSQNTWPVRLVQGLIIGGALGNLWDRMARPPGGFLGGHVVDFLRVPHWPVFNVADMAITCGAVALAWMITRIPVDGEGEPAEAANGGSEPVVAANGDSEPARAAERATQPEVAAEERVSDVLTTETVADDR